MQSNGQVRPVSLPIAPYPALVLVHVSASEVLIREVPSCDSFIFAPVTLGYDFSLGGFHRFLPSRF